MSEDELIEAAPCKLRNGDWGCKTQEPVEAGATVRIVTRANKQWRAEIAQVIWTDGTVCICATESENQKDKKSGTPDDTTDTPPAKRSKPAKPQSRPAASEHTKSDDAPPAPPRTDVPPTDELDAMADSAADQDDDDFDALMNAVDESERNPR